MKRSWHIRFDRALLRVIKLCGKLPHGHEARALLFKLAGSPRGVQTVTELRAILSLARPSLVSSF